MSNWEAFNKYIGVQGILAVVLLCGFVAAIFARITLPDLYDNLMTFVIGFYFAKNGVGVLTQLANVFKADVHVKTKGK